MGVTILQTDVADAVIQVTFWTSFIFVPIVSFFWPWWKNWFGRAIIAIDILLTLSFGPSVFRLYFPGVQDEPWFTWLAIAAFGLIPIRTTILTYVMWRVQHEEKIVIETHRLRRHPEPPEPAEPPEFQKGKSDGTA